MNHSETSTRFGALRHGGPGSVSEDGLERTVGVDGPAAPPVSTGSKVTALPVAPPCFSIVLQLAGGASMDVGTFDERRAALRAARQTMRVVKDATDEWPMLGGSFVRPDAILAIEIVER